MRRDATRGRRRSITKCEITGNRKARWRGWPRDIGFSPQPSGPPGTRCSPRCSRLAPPFFSRVAPSVWPLPCFSPGTPRGRLSRRRGVFRARLRKKLAFLPRFSVLSRPNSAPKSPVFRNLAPRFRNLALSLALPVPPLPLVSPHQARQPPARAVSRRRRKPSSRGTATEAMRRDADGGTGVPSQSARLRGTEKHAARVPSRPWLFAPAVRRPTRHPLPSP